MADYNFITLTGTIVPDTQDILAQVEAEYKQAFGQDLVVTTNTPQGLLIAAETTARQSVVRNNAAIANQINPNLAGGVALDAICALTGIVRQPATFSTAVINLTGTAGTLVTSLIIQNSATGTLWNSVGLTTLNGSGLGSITVQAQLTGPLIGDPGTLTIFYQGQLGVETATNLSSAILGSDIQSDESLREYRISTLAFQGSGFIEAMYAGLLSTAGVLSCYVDENVANTTQVRSGVTMVAHSMYACVYGGTDSDVATAIIEKKDGGCDYNNGASTTPISFNYVSPVNGVTYVVKFDRPNLIPIFVRVTIKNNTSVANPITAVKQAILDYANGVINGEPGFKIGTSVSPYELGGAINQEYPQIFVLNVELSLDGLTWGVATLPVAVFAIATIDSTNITVNVT